MSTPYTSPGPGHIAGELAVVGDKSVSHRALMMAALANGTSRIEGLSTGDDVARTDAEVTFSMIDRRPRAPVRRSAALVAIAFKAFSVNLRSASSIENKC